METKNKKTDSKEVLQVEAKEYIGEFYIRLTSFDINGIDLAQMTTNQPVEKQKEFAEIIVRAVNERQKLLDSNRELEKEVKKLVHAFDKAERSNGYPCISVPMLESLRKLERIVLKVTSEDKTTWDELQDNLP